MNGGGGEKRKTNDNELAQQKNKRPFRGTGVEKLERLRLQERWKTNEPYYHPQNYFPWIYPAPVMNNCGTDKVRDRIMLNSHLVSFLTSPLPIPPLTPQTLVTKRS